MKNKNPALDALNEYDEKENDSSKLIYITNGIRTCGPLFSAALNYDSTEIDKDIDEMLSSTKNLIEKVKNILLKKEIKITEYENSAINAFCIQVVAENWKTSQEVFETLVDPVVNSLIEQGISAEDSLCELQTFTGSEISANIIISGKIFCTLSNNNLLDIEKQNYTQCIKEVLSSANRAIEKLTQFHIPYEDAEALAGHITIEAGNIFISILRREIKIHEDKERYLSMNNEENNYNFQLDTIFRIYRVSMQSFVDAIYVNSRMVN